MYSVALQYGMVQCLLGASPWARSQSHLIPAACTLQSGWREARVGGLGLRYEGRRVKWKWAGA